MTESTGMLATGLALLLAGAAPAAAETDFYHGKMLTLVVGTTAGGGYDQYARSFARYFPKYLPGAPTVIVKNLPTAGSLTSVLSLDANFPPDGTYITSFNAGLIAESLGGGEHVKARFTDYAWLGSIARDLRVCFTWGSTGIKNWADLVAHKGVTFGTTGPNSNSYNGAAILKNVFHLDVRPILGYPGNSELHLAVERGEIDGECASWPAIPDEWVEKGKINILARLAAAPMPELPNVPFLGDLATTDEQHKLLDVLLAAGDLGRPYIVSKKVPAERLALLRHAFDATLADKDFLADAVKQNLPVSPTGAAEAQAIIERLYAMPPELIEKARVAIK